MHSALPVRRCPGLARSVHRHRRRADVSPRGRRRPRAHWAPGLAAARCRRVPHGASRLRIAGPGGARRTARAARALARRRDGTDRCRTWRAGRDTRMADDVGQSPRHCDQRPRDAPVRRSVRAPSAARERSMTLAEAAEPFQDRRALVVGGLGFIGAAIAKALVDAGAEVLIVDALIAGCGGTYANIAGFADRVSVVEADVRNAAALPALLDGRDVVFNLAGKMSHLDSMEEPTADLQHNCRAQLMLLEACRRTASPPTVVFAGTRQIYGRPQYLPVDESHPIEPVDVNGIHKHAAEQYHLLYSRLYGFPVAVLRLTNTYGPGMRIRDARQTFLGIWLQSLIRGREFEVWGDGSQLRDFTYVDDAVTAFLLAANDPRAQGRPLNLGGER